MLTLHGSISKNGFSLFLVKISEKFINNSDINNLIFFIQLSNNKCQIVKVIIDFNNEQPGRCKMR